MTTPRCPHGTHADSYSRTPVRTLLDLFAAIPDSTPIQIEATKESAEWAKNDKRIFLKQNLETRLVAL